MRKSFDPAVERSKLEHMIAKKVMEEIEALPAEAQREVIDFVGLLRTRYARRRRRKAATPATRGDFVGMWKDRADYRDSVAAVARLRDREWTRR